MPEAVQSSNVQRFKTCEQQEWVWTAYYDHPLSAAEESCRSAPEEAINYAPYTEASLKAEIATRFTRGLPGAKQVVAGLLSVPPLWVVARNLLARIDNRPGRLYSFVAYRP